MHWQISDYWTRTSAILSSTTTSPVSSINPVTTTTTVQSTLTSETIVTSFPSIFTPTTSVLPTVPSSTTTGPCTTITTMPTLLSTLTSTLIVTIGVTAIPQTPPDIPSAIRGLTDCVQNVLFPLLANSQCNPANFPCICTELARLQARTAVDDACPADVELYDDFAVNTCGNIAQVVTVNQTSVEPITVIPVVVSTGVPNNFTTAVGLFTNGTAAPVAPASTLPPIVVVPSAQPAPATASSPAPAPQSGPSGPGSTTSPAEPQSPSNPEFSGAAVSGYGKTSMAGFASGMGIMWLAFAQL